MRKLKSSFIWNSFFSNSVKMSDVIVGLPLHLLFNDLIEIPSSQLLCWNTHALQNQLHVLTCPSMKMQVPQQKFSKKNCFSLSIEQIDKLSHYDSKHHE